MRISRVIAATSILLAGAVIVCPVASAAGDLDQSVVTSNNSYSPTIVGAVVGQSFTAGITGQLMHVELSVTVPGTPANPFTLYLYEASGGLPTGAPLASSAVPAGDFAITVNITPTWVDFVFPNPATITAGNQYVLTESMTGSGQYSVYYGVPSYAGGSAVYDAGAGWVVSGGSDLLFRTYVLPTPESGATPPPVLQQFELASSGLRAAAACDSSATSALNWGGSSSGNWGNSWAQWANGGTGGPVCTRTLIYSNSLGHWVAS